MTTFNRNHPYYKDDILKAIQQTNVEIFRNKAFLITGATGMLGTFLIDVLMFLNSKDYCIRIYALGRCKQRACDRLGIYFEDPWFEFIEQDIQNPLPDIKVDYIISGASNAHPKAYQADLVGTILTNIMGTVNVLNLAKSCGAKVLLMSTVEIYGENKGDISAFTEDYTGSLPLNNTRQCYPESKRLAEVLCQSYHAQYGVTSYIVRLCRSFGPTMIESDSKASAQFLKKAKSGQDIVLKSNGEQLFSYTYTADVISAILFVLEKGVVIEPYNVASKDCDIKLKDFAQLIASQSGTKVIFDLPDEQEKKGFSLVQKALMDGSKLEKLGWRSQYKINEAIDRTLNILSI